MIEKEDEPLIIALAKEGLTAMAIAEKFDVTSTEIKKFCTSKDVFVRTYKRQPRSREETNELIRKMLKTERYSQNYISETLQVDKSWVLKMQIELGYAIEGKVFNAKRQRMERLTKQVRLLRRDGMTSKEACAVVGISTSSYNRHYKKAATF